MSKNGMIPRVGERDFNLILMPTIVGKTKHLQI